MTELATLGGTNTENLEKLIEAIPNLKTGELVDVFSKLHDIHRLSKEAEDKMKVELRKRQSEGGRDAKGNSYLAGETGGVRLEARTSFELKKDAVRLIEEAGLAHLFPQQPNIELMREILKALNVEDRHYMKSMINATSLVELVERGEIDVTFAQDLFTSKSTWAVRNVGQEKVLNDRD